MIKYIAYLRVSTDKQGREGLGIEAQRATIAAFARNDEIVAEYVEVESGRKIERPELNAAIKLTKKTKGVLLVARLDRLSRSSFLINTLIHSGVEFKACDQPHANKLTIQLLTAVAEYEADRISANTKAALAAAKARGVVLGGPVVKARAAQSAKARVLSEAARAATNECRLAGMTYAEIAMELQKRGIRTRRNHVVWAPSQVWRLIDGN